MTIFMSSGWLLVYCLRKDFTQNVIPDLIKPAPYLIRGNPVFSAGFPFSRERQPLLSL